MQNKDRYANVVGLKGFLILTSTEDKTNNNFYGNAMWFVSDADIEKSRSAKPNGTDFPVTAKQIWDFPHDPKDTNYVEMKAEGISLLNTTTPGKTRLVIVYDNDPANWPNDRPKHASKMECVEMTNDLKISRIGC